MSNHWLLIYDYVEDILDKRGPHREAHLAAARAMKEDAKIVMAGAVGDPPHGAVFVWTDRDAVDAFVEADPYVQAGLVTGWRVEPWNVVI